MGCGLSVDAWTPAVRCEVERVCGEVVELARAALSRLVEARDGVLV